MEIDLAQELIALQFPQWADLPVAKVPSGGTDNDLFRLGETMAVRFPRSAKVAEHVEKEQKWLPLFAPQLPLAIPVPIGKGAPAKGYLWNWSIYRWIEGETAKRENLIDLKETATALGEFLRALQQIDPAGGPPSGAQNEYRGAALQRQDGAVRDALQVLRMEYDTTLLRTIWEGALRANAAFKPVFLHGDLHEGNLLAKHGRLAAVIDFGLMGVGDPACDLMVGWTLLSKSSRKTFRKAAAIDDPTWERGRGWALSFGLSALAYYLNSNPILATIARRTIGEVLEG